jgi:hypothetical protein
MYETVIIRGIDGEEMMVHMCCPFSVNQNMVEIHTQGGVPVVLSKEQFDSMVAWVSCQFEKLSHKKQTIH